MEDEKVVAEGGKQEADLVGSSALLDGIKATHCATCLHFKLLTKSPESWGICTKPIVDCRLPRWADKIISRYAGSGALSPYGGEGCKAHENAV